MTHYIVISPRNPFDVYGKARDLVGGKWLPNRGIGLDPDFSTYATGGGGFAANTRRKVVRQPSLVKPSGGGLSEMTIQSTGLLARIWLRISATISGTLTNPNPLGVSSIIRRVSLRANSGLELFSVSGPGYAWLLQHHLESEYFPMTPQNQGRQAVTTGTFNLDMVVPVCVSMNDFTGLILLQSKQIAVTLQVDWATDTSVATGATVAATCIPYVEYYTVPPLPEDRPALNRAQLILQDDLTISGAGEHIYEPIVGPRYIQIIHGLNYGVNGADDIDNARLRVEQSNYLFDVDIDYLNMEWRAFHNAPRPAGVWSYDFAASSGLGVYGGARDLVNTAQITSFESVFNALGSGSNLTTIRRMLVDVA